MYAIGDVQGCYEPLRALLRLLGFKPDRDRLMFTGDLVNRGPRSLDVLRFVADLGPCAATVLGNHDLNLLAVAAGVREPRSGDTIADVLEAADGDALLKWLRERPMLIHDAQIDCALVHAGLHPSWTLPLARALAGEVEAVLRRADSASFLENMYGDRPHRWRADLTGWERLRFIANTLTRARFFAADGRLDFSHSGPPGSQPPELVPWFAIPQRRSRSARIVFGHWSSLGCWHHDGVIGLDSGCVWGRGLTAVRLDTDPVRFFRVPCGQQA